MDTSRPHQRSLTFQCHKTTEWSVVPRDISYRVGMVDPYTDTTFQRPSDLRSGYMDIFIDNFCPATTSSGQSMQRYKNNVSKYMYIKHPYDLTVICSSFWWSIWGSHQTLWSLPLQNVTWHSGTWPYTMTPSIDQTLHLFANLLPNWTLIPILTLLPNFGGFHRTLQRVRLANRGRLLLRTPGPVPFGTCICSNVETILSWNCHVYGPFEFRTSLGTSILLWSAFIYENKLLS